MDTDKTTTDWELKDHIANLRAIPLSVECEAVKPMSDALIFFGRQLGDVKRDVATTPLKVMELLNARQEASTPLQPTAGVSWKVWSQRAAMEAIRRSPWACVIVVGLSLFKWGPEIVEALGRAFTGGS